MNYKKYIIILIILLILILTNLLLFKKDLNKYENMMNEKEIIVFNLNKSAGFYSIFFFLLNNYMYCKKNNYNFKIKSDEWLFNSKNGWSDYFEPIELIYNKDTLKEKHTGHSTVLDNYSLKEYQNFIPELYKYNERTKNEINKIYTKFNLVNGQYDSIFIRRGDKLASESVFISEEKYINILLQKNSNCKIIYLQTDDYNCYKNIKQYIENNNLKITIYTLCPENSVGVIVKNQEKHNLNNSPIIENADYLSQNINKLNQTKTVEDMNSDEIYNHTIDMIVGVDIVINSNICITDFQSNVSRFIKLAHNNPKNVYNVLNINEDIDYEKIIVPAYSF